MNFDVPIDASYEDLQEMVFLKQSQKSNNNNNKSVSQVIFYAQVLPESSSEKLKVLLPNTYKKAIQFSSFYKLFYKFLDPPATLYSLSMFREISIDLYGIDHVKETKHNLWIGKNQSISSIISMIPNWFHKVPTYYLVSVPSPNAIYNILNPEEKISKKYIRIDLLKTPFASNTLEMLAELEKKGSHSSSIEVRSLSFEGMFPKLKTYGFYSFTTKTTLKDILQKVSGTYAEVLQRKAFLIRGHEDIKENYQLTGKEAMGDIIKALAKLKNWKNIRPYFAIQMTERPKVDQMPGYPTY